MSLNDLLDDLSDRARPRVSFGRVPFDPGVVLRESTLDRVRQDGEAVGRLRNVVLDVFDKPPRTVSAVVSRSSAGVEEVRDETVLEDGTEGVDVLSSGREGASGKEETSERNEDLLKRSGR